MIIWLIIMISSKIKNAYLGQYRRDDRLFLQTFPVKPLEPPVIMIRYSLIDSSNMEAVSVSGQRQLLHVEILLSVPLYNSVEICEYKPEWTRNIAELVNCNNVV